MTELRRRFIRDLEIKNFAAHTIKNYVSAIEKLAKHYKKCPSELSEEALKDYLGKIVSQKKSWSHVNIIQSAMKKLYIGTLNQEYKVSKITRPKVEHKVKSIISRQEIEKLFDSCNNIKHKVIFMTMYGCGLRVSEVTNLMAKDIDSARMVIQVKNPKGHCEREVLMPPELLNWLRQLYKEQPTKEYLFRGQGSNLHITERTVQAIFQQRIKQAGILKKVSTHDLRHTHTTHSIEEGSDLIAVQKNLGHQSIKTTLGYYHLTTKLQKTLISPLSTLPKYGKGGI